MDLSNIITDPSAAANLEKLNDIIKNLKDFETKSISQECCDLLIALKQECDKGIQYRVHAGLQ